ncbi:MAG: SH3 domain-containing protein, partial [Firmicutes bacterium]|nr:SH3 domain-containing protein [Bacillota bacterium]
EVEAELAALKGSGNVTPPSGNNNTTPSGNNTNVSGNQSNTSSRTVRSNSDSLRIRKGPGTNYEIVGQMSNGDTATYLGTESGWYKIQRGSVTGYVSSQYATLQ